MPAPSGKTTIAGSLSSRLSELGIELPKPPTPLGAHLESAGPWGQVKRRLLTRYASSFGIPMTST